MNFRGKQFAMYALLIGCVLFENCFVFGATTPTAAPPTTLAPNTTTTTPAPPTTLAPNATNTTTTTPAPPTTLAPNATNTTTTTPAPPTTTSTNTTSSTSAVPNTTKAPVITNATTTTTTTTSTPKPTPPARTTNVDQLTVALPFTIKYNDSFTTELTNKDSEVFKNYSLQYETQLSEAFKNTTGFLSVTIIRFWPGSIGVDYKVNYSHAAVANSTQLQAQLAVVKINLQNDKGVDVAYLNKTFENEAANAAKFVDLVKTDPCINSDACHQFETCTLVENGTKVSCSNPCDGHYCGNGGVCELNEKGDPKCRCQQNDRYVYGGDTCEEKAEKLKMSSADIIAIAAGVGGGLVFILTVALVITCLRRKHKRMEEKMKEPDQKSDVSFQSIGPDNVISSGPPQPPPANRLYRQQPNEPYLRQDSGLPMEAFSRSYEHRPSGSRPNETSASPSGQMKYGEDGRLYRVVKESQIYGSQQPGQSFRNQAFEHFPEDAPLSDRGRSESAYSRSSHQRLGGERPPVKENVYTAVDDDTFMYQPSDVVTRQRFSGTSHLNPLVAADPIELSGFPRQDDVRRFEESSRYSDERSPRRDSPVRGVGGMDRDRNQDRPSRRDHEARPSSYPSTDQGPRRESFYNSRDGPYSSGRDGGAYPPSSRDGPSPRDEGRYPREESRFPPSTREASPYTRDREESRYPPSSSRDGSSPREESRYPPGPSPREESRYPPGPREESRYPPSTREGRAESTGYPPRESPYNRDPYPAKEDTPYSKVLKAAPGGPAYRDDGLTSSPAPAFILIHDFSEPRSAGNRPGYGPYTSGADKSRDKAPSTTSQQERGRIYDFIPEGKVSIQRPLVSTRPSQM